MDSPSSRYQYLIHQFRLKQKDVATASGLSNSGLSDMITRNRLTMSAVIGLKKIEPLINVNWIIDGLGKPLLEAKDYERSRLISIDESPLLKKIAELELRIKKLESENEKQKDSEREESDY